MDGAIGGSLGVRWLAPWLLALSACAGLPSPQEPTPQPLPNANETADAVAEPQEAASSPSEASQAVAPASPKDKELPAPTEAGAAPFVGKQKWSPPAPNPKEFDWIRLNSDEWLKGEIRVMRDFELEFDSDKLDELTLDWRDVAEVRSARPYAYVFDDRLEVDGTAIMRDGVVRVRSEDGGVEEFDRTRLTAIVPAGHRELDFWSGTASLGLAARSGNTDQVDFTGRALLERETPFTRYSVQYNGAIGTLDSQKNTDNHRISLDSSIFLTRKFFVTPASLEYFRDEFQNVDYRVTPVVGVGYRILRRADIKWDVDLGGGYQLTQFVSTSAFGGGGSSQETGVLSVGTSWEWELTKRIDLDGSVRVDLGVPDVSQTNEHADTTLSVELTDIFDLDISFTFDRQEDPERDASGEVPEKNDYRLSVGFAVDF